MTKQILIDAKPIAPAPDCDIVQVEPGVYSILRDGASYEVRVGAEQVHVGERRFDFGVDDPRKWKRSAAGGAAHGNANIAAPMPGKIVRLLVASGDIVEPGQGVIVVEAMKMQNELKSPIAGRVSAVRCAENDSVNAGAVLVVIEPKPAAEPTA